MKIISTLLLCLLFFHSNLSAQDYLERYNKIDVKHYELFLKVNDSTDAIDARMQIHLNFRRNTDSFTLDLVALDTVTGIGMRIDSIYQNKVPVDFEHQDNKIEITPKHVFPGVTYTYTISYHGVPKDGLIISKNMYGERTFFGDNWPNRARFWLPSVDHPADKATFESHITAPNHYQVIANGSLIEKTNLPNEESYYHWKTTAPLSTKVMVVAIARFAVQNVGYYNQIPVSTWVYPQTKDAGFHDFANAGNIMNFLIDYIGPYPFQKLANVQSKTRFGGMENAGNIFYFEKSVNGKREREELIAHEIAHQWFGNSATEIDWPHVWLSEGFATYMTNLFIFDSKGEDAFKETLKAQRSKVLNYYKRAPNPIIDVNTKDYMKLLNANSYQKGAWVLHMLRKKVGDDNFKKGLRQYYDTYKFANASTDDFKRVMSQVSGQNLDTFFYQWLYQTGQPKIKTDWIYYDNKVRMIVDQLQDIPFEFLLDLEFTMKDGTKEIKTIEVLHKSSPFVIDISGEVKDVTLDPNCWLLYETEEK